MDMFMLNKSGILKLVGDEFIIRSYKLHDSYWINWMHDFVFSVFGFLKKPQDL
jgi:hypothetical protein